MEILKSNVNFKEGSGIKTLYIHQNSEQQLEYGCGADDVEGIELDELTFDEKQVIYAECSQSLRGVRNFLTGEMHKRCFHKGIFATSKKDINKHYLICIK
jgi:hypothetical protein